MSSNSSMSNSATTLEISSPQYTFQEIQPGLAVSVSESQAGNTVKSETSFPGDNEYIHLNCILAGRFEANVKDIQLQCVSGDVNIGFSDGEMFQLPANQTFSNLALMVTPEVLYKLAGEEMLGIDFDKISNFFIKHGCSCHRVMAAAVKIVNLMKERSPKPLLLHSAMLDYLHWHLNACKENKTSETISIREKKQLMMARDYLVQDLSSPPTIAELARAIGLNQCKLKRGFKSLFGESIYSYFQQQRMTEAMKLLKKNNVTETAILLGYSNISHFSSAFRKQFGVLPRQARQELEPDLPKIITFPSSAY